MDAKEVTVTDFVSDEEAKAWAEGITNRKILYTYTDVARLLATREA